MPVQKGIMILKGSICGNTYYQVNGKNFVRKKSSLNKAAMLNNPAFETVWKNAVVFGKAASLAARVYRFLPNQQKQHGLIGKIIAHAVKLLRNGNYEIEIIGTLALKFTA